MSLISNFYMLVKNPVVFISIIMLQSKYNILFLIREITFTLNLYTTNLFHKKTIFFAWASTFLTTIEIRQRFSSFFSTFTSFFSLFVYLVRFNSNNKRHCVTYILTCVPVLQKRMVQPLIMKTGKNSTSVLKFTQFCNF